MIQLTKFQVSVLIIFREVLKYPSEHLIDFRWIRSSTSTGPSRSRKSSTGRGKGTPSARTGDVPVTTTVCNRIRGKSWWTDTRVGTFPTRLVDLANVWSLAVIRRGSVC